jgi:hypothetical protein
MSTRSKSDCVDGIEPRPRKLFERLVQRCFRRWNAGSESCGCSINAASAVGKIYAAAKIVGHSGAEGKEIGH